jgi:hypothetical protein
MGIFSKPAAHSVLLVDIASSSVGIGLSGIKDGGVPELVFTTRVPFAYKQDFDYKHIEHACIHSLRDALNIALKEGTKILKGRGYPASVNHAIISFSSPWYMSELGTDTKQFHNRLENEFDSKMEVFESDMGVMSASDKRFIRKIEEEVIRTFGIEKGIGLSSFTFMFSRVISHAFHGIDPAVFVDMTGHTTDVLSTASGVYHGSFSVPVGTHSLRCGNCIPWDEYWAKINERHDDTFHKGNIFLIADEYDLAKDYLHRVMPRARIIPFGKSEGFLTEMVKVDPTLLPVERLAILATYSNLFL